jgi:phosphoribosylanthranilate isomerase
MTATIIQIYEIQTPQEARAVIALGVDHIGSVVTSQRDRHDPVIRATVELVRELGAVSSLIPLYTQPEAVFDTLDYYRPDIIHFCDALAGGGVSLDAALELQAAVRSRFAGVRIMRAIPIPRRATTDLESILSLAACLEPLTDLFLTDTLLADESGVADIDQPVDGFVGITGLTCDWSVAAALVAQSRIPVILAGGISPQNVVAGMAQVRPFGVDSCTCTNAIDGKGRPIRFKKEIGRVRSLVAAVRQMDNAAPWVNAGSA